MKYTLHVPVQEYGFIEAEVEGTVEDAAKEYRAIRKAYILDSGKSEKEYREIYDAVAQGEAINGDPGMLSELSIAQKYSINDIKKYIKRSKDKNHDF